MKTTLLFYLILCTNILMAQTGISWMPEITIASSSYDNQHPRIMLNRSGYPLVIWGKLSTNEVYFSRYDGTSFTMPVALNNSSVPVFTASWAGPDIASFGDTVYVTMKETPEDVNHMYMVSSYDGGNTFSPPVQIDNFVDTISRFPSVSTDSSGNPVIAYMNFESGFTNPSYDVIRSTDFGQTFINPVPASQYSGGKVCDCCPAGITNSGSTIAVMYRDNLNDLRDIWTGISTDNGLTFPSGMNVDHTNWMINACPSSGPDGIIIGDSLYTVWMSSATNTSRCYISRSSLSGLNAGADEFLTSAIPGLTAQNYPRIAHAGNKVSVVCKNTINGTGQVALFYSEDITASSFSQGFDVVASGNIENADVAIDNSNVYVVWEDNASGSVKIRIGQLPATTGINALSKPDILIYPSPATNYFQIKTISPLQQVSMSDLSGKEVELQYFPGQAETICSFNASDGYYLVRILTAGQTLVYPFVISNK